MPSPMHQRCGVSHRMQDACEDDATIGETVFDPDVIKWCFDIALLGGRATYAATDPRVSPVYGACKGLPPVYMMAAAAEVRVVCGFTKGRIRPVIVKLPMGIGRLGWYLDQCM